MDSLFGYDYSKGEEPLTWGDFSIVEFYISFGIIGIILFFLFSFSKMNKTNFVAILIGLLGYPSVDVSYSDAATGAKQIKLLGLSGTYVQMLTENVPNLRGAALPYSLGYVPGP